ncbi:hypothetical protein DL98DRAFT_592198 [Cadophora sp. DSE1049]|nr:hypothetical protein DL98DRAFT_592198 [Cadophora sp. DSE1049]
MAQEGEDRSTGSNRGFLKTSSGKLGDPYEKIQIDYENETNYMGKLEITLHRTFRGTTKHGAPYPLGFGRFPLYSVSHFKEGFTKEAVTDGDCFIPMYQREAAWIHLTSTHPFAVKIFSGQRNILWGTAPEDQEHSGDWERAEKAKGAPQDYIVSPDHQYICGIKDNRRGSYTDITASRTTTGYSLTSPLTNLEGLQSLGFEVIPCYKPLEEVWLSLYNYIPNSHRPGLYPQDFPIEYRFRFLCHYRPVPRHSWMLTLNGERITSEEEAVLSNDNVDGWRNMHLTVGNVGLTEGSVVALVPNPNHGAHGFASCTAASIPSAPEIFTSPFHVDESKMGLYRDDRPEDSWDTNNAFFVKLHLLNIAKFEAITGMPAPETPVTELEYASHGYQFLDSYREIPSDNQQSRNLNTDGTREAGLVAAVGTMGTKERRTFVSRNKKTGGSQNDGDGDTEIAEDV